MSNTNPASSRDSTPQSSSEKIVLVAEDVKPLRDNLVKVLGASGYRACDAANGMDAIARVLDGDKEGVALVVLDLMMPVLDGLGFLKRLRDRPGYEKLPVIIISGVQDSAVRQQAETMGISAFLVKPFKTADLLEKVKEILE